MYETLFIERFKIVIEKVELAAVAVQFGDSGEQVFERLLALRPGDARAHIAYAEFLVRNGAAQEATTHLESSIDQGADPPVTLSALLELQYQLGHTRNASKTVDRLQEEHPEHPLSVLAAARRDIAEGRAEAAAAVLRETVVARQSFRAEQLLALEPVPERDLRALARQFKDPGQLIPVVVNPTRSAGG